MTRGSSETCVDGAFGEHAAFVQHGHLDAEGAHERHVVLDDDHRLLRGDLLEQLGGRLGLGVGHAGGGLVDEQQLRLLREQHADLQPLLLAVAEVGGLGVAPVGKADDAEQFLDARRRHPR